MLPQSVRKLVAYHEVLMAMILVWVVSPVVLTLFSFYLGTFAASQHVQDLQGGDVDNGAKGALIGLAVSVIIAIGATIIYPKVIAREYEVRGRSDDNHADY
ncbi:hypothetical protein [Fimbriimonas ginsengisoli]|uniref:Uncharacterized protein n=1 Tax=Fimbriimonas ginsengisoli Gsoil 348 TaxID=661478 RepID=A0A068NJ50_FIMGI|nr:hypothetical protein [Fimbriimonas ginsengisoli]AIE83487.1 hypothetical protein OP10G_0119 [Fimbriimonas ginsengisoli Gsoil 348]